MKRKIREYFKANRDGIKKNALGLLAELVAVKSVNCGKAQMSDHPYLSVCGDESKVVDILKTYFDKAGFSYLTHEGIKGRANIIARYGKGEKSLCIGCHTDIVPAGERSAWETDPFVLTEKDGKAYGRGTLDNKGPIVACTMAMEILKSLGIELKGELILACIAGEEFHEKDEPDPGIKFLAKEGLLKPTFAIIPDIGEHMASIDIAEKGRAVIKVTSIGKQAHGSTPELGINAVEKLAQFIVNVTKLELKYTPHEILKKPSVNLGIVRGGSAVNNVPNNAEATFDIRYVPGQTAKGLVEEFRTCAKGIIDGKFEFEIMDDNPPHQVDPDNILVKTIQANTKEIVGKEPVVFGMGGGTFAKPFNLSGILAVGFGPGESDCFHVANEYLEIDEMLQFIELIACVSCDLLGVEN